MSKKLKPDAKGSGTFTFGGDMKVRRLGYGALQITGLPGVWGWPKNIKEARAVLRRAVDLGINFIDTADSYGPETSELLIAEALHPYPKGLVIATKGGLTRPGPDIWEPVGRAPYIQQCVELSLRRLKLDCIDLYQLHRLDPRTPMEETLGALAKLKKQGKIRHFGLSEVSIKEIKEARRHIPVVSVQNLYNLGERKHEDVLEFCEKEKLGFIPWCPMAAGALAKPGGVLDRVSRKHGATVSQLALAWLLKRSPVILPIPGTASVKHLVQNTAAASLKLSAAEYQEIEEAARAMKPKTY